MPKNNNPISEIANVKIAQRLFTKIEAMEKRDFKATDADKLMREIYTCEKFRFVGEDMARMLAEKIDSAVSRKIYDITDATIKNGYSFAAQRFAVFDKDKADELARLGTAIARVVAGEPKIKSFVARWGDYEIPPDERKMFVNRKLLADEFATEIAPILIKLFPQTPTVEMAFFELNPYRAENENVFMIADMGRPGRIEGNLSCCRDKATNVISALAHEIYHLHQTDKKQADKTYAAAEHYYSGDDAALYYGNKLEREAYFLQFVTIEKIADIRQNGRTAQACNAAGARGVASVHER